MGVVDRIEARSEQDTGVIEIRTHTQEHQEDTRVCVSVVCMRTVCVSTARGGAKQTTNLFRN